MTTPFHPLQPLPRGTTLLEASAGTGKTWSITTLVLRLVAEEGLRMSELLLVTFTEAATEELKDRVRLRLAEASAALQPGAAPAAEPTLAAWVEGLGADGRVRAHRALLRAAEEFDQAAISTIHAFCKRTLEELAFESGAELGLDLVQDLSPYVEEIVDDVLTADLVDLDPQTWRAVALGCDWSRAGLGALARLALQDPRAAVLPAPQGLAALRADWLARRGALADRLRQTWGPALIAEFEAALKPRLKPRQRTWSVQRLRDDIDAAVDALAEAPLPGPAAIGALAEWAAPRAFAKQLADDAPARLCALDPLRPWTEPAALAGPLRAHFVARLRARLAARKAEDGVCGFDDLLLLLRDRLVDPLHGPALASALGARYRGVFIDEFQDTDAVQWTIFERCFHEAGRSAGAPSHHLFLIGDPKQAIYRFRGADLHVYLRAAAQADLRFTMTRNHRSDAAAVRATNLLLGDDADGVFCQPPISYIEVDTPARAPAQRLRGPDGAPAIPLCLRWVDPAAVARAGAESDEVATAEDLRAALRPQLVDDAVGLLSGGHTLWSQGRWRPLAPGDLAVLTRRNDEATALAAALVAAGVPAVVRSSASVFATPEAETLTAFLQALMDPGREGPARALALSPGWGWTVEGLMQPGAAWEAWLARLRRWRRTMEGAGLMVALRAALDELELIPRLLAQPGGARAVTNLQHVAELAHAAERTLRLGLPSLLAWLLRQRAERPEDADAVVLRLETDDEAVSVLTMHRSKGLEYPVVLLPELWMRPGGGAAPYALGRDPSDPDGLRRILDLREGDPALDALHQAADREGLQEDMRLLYVALTRARHQTYLYTGPVKRLERSPLAVLLHAARPGAAPADRAAAAVAVAGRAPAALRADLAAWVAALEAKAPGSAALLPAGPLRPRRWTPPPAPAEALTAAAWTRGPFSTRWQRYSYSALTRGQHGAAAAAPVAPAMDEAPAVDPRRPGFDPDRVRAQVVDDDAVEAVSNDLGLPVPLAEAPANAEAGTFLHAVLEHTDFTWVEGGAEGAARFAAVIAAQLGHHGFSAADWGPQLGPGLCAALQTPLGGPLGARALASVPRGDRLDELRFDLPISGGDRWRREGRPLRPVTTQGFAGAFAQRPPDAAMSAAYIRGLQRLELGELVGFLTGSIDLVLRAEVDGRPRWFVVDYKSNRLALPGRLPTTGAYTLPQLRAAMEEHHYFVQYHLYTLALHRYLRSRLGAAYDYARDFGGVYYLFLRGMIGPDTPTVEGQRTGVFFDKPPAGLISALDQLFGAEEA